jgi:hypothetical protein
MTIVEGEKFKHKLNGQLYQVKMIKNGTVILESEDSPNRMWFGENDVEIFFDMVKKRKGKPKILGAILENGNRRAIEE